MRARGANEGVANAVGVVATIGGRGGIAVTAEKVANEAVTAEAEVSRADEAVVRNAEASAVRAGVIEATAMPRRKKLNRCRKSP